MLVLNNHRYIAYQLLQLDSQSELACYEVTDQTVSDNGPQFISNEFRENSVNTFTAPPTIHPQRFVRSFEEAMTACDNDNSSLDHRIDNFLYRSTTV